MRFAAIAMITLGSLEQQPAVAAPPVAVAAPAVAIATMPASAAATAAMSKATAAAIAPVDSLVSSLAGLAPGLRPEVLRLALKASETAEKSGLVAKQNLLTVIDYSMPSTQPRLFVFDIASKRLLFRELVAHGKNSGDNETKFFSNEDGSLATSLGLFVTDNPYFGNNGYSLRLKGLDAGFNDHAWQRAIVVHGASYVSDMTAKALGRLGRSWGCPAVRPEVAKKLIDTLKGGSPIFAYYPDSDWLHSSKFLAQ